MYWRFDNFFNTYDLGVEMVVAHNLQAQNANRQLSIVGGVKQKSTEKLSSGYRINRAADDAAGLSISEKLRWQIRGLDKGASNINDGISLIQTADGALNEVHGILQRVRELSVQALNDTNTQTDRDAIQVEIDESLKEIDRIKETTMFNTMPILQGAPMKKVKATPDQIIEVIKANKVNLGKPDWLIADKSMLIPGADGELTTHTNYNYTQENTEAEIWGKSKQNPDGSFSYYYYGVQSDTQESYGLIHAAEWTDTTADNPSACIDFSAIANQSSLQGLKEKLEDLYGTQIIFPWGDGGFVESISYSSTIGTKVDMMGEGAIVGASPYAKVDLGKTPFSYDGNDYEGYFSIINEYLTNDENMDASALSKAIARDLRDKSVSALGHISPNRSLAVGDNPYKYMVYDPRDYGKMSGPVHKDTNTDLYFYRPNLEYSPGESYVIDGEHIMVRDSFHIMCGALSNNSIKLDLPNLGDINYLSGYQINKYEDNEYLPSSLNLMDKAIDDVSSMRAMLGAQQNRLEYSYNINQYTSENTSASESRMRDTDMAKEMVNYSKNDILQQAGQSVLSQANQSTQGVLSIIGAR
jgi:flagellin